MRNEDEFWTRLEDVEAGMLGLIDRADRFPVAPLKREDADGQIWFVTKQAPALVTPLTRRPEQAQFIVADGASGLYGNLMGELALIDDPDILTELWTPATQSWLAASMEDARLRLLCFTLQSGTVWYSSVKGVTFLCEFMSEVPAGVNRQAFAGKVG